MKVVFATVAFSLAASVVQFSPAFGQARGGGGAAGGAGSAGGGRAAITPSAPVNAGPVSAGGITGPQSAGPAGTTIGTPATGAPYGPINPGGITATPSQVAGRTFERTTIGGAPLETVVDPAGPQPTFRFPPASELQQPIRTNFGLAQFPEGFPPVAAVGNAPVSAGNTAGGNFPGANIRPVEPVAINLPPGARITTNFAGVPQIGFPRVNVPLTTNAVGSSPRVQSSTERVGPITPAPVAPLPAPTTVPR
jgi:hypothetical protein